MGMHGIAFTAGTCGVPDKPGGASTDGRPCSLLAEARCAVPKTEHCAPVKTALGEFSWRRGVRMDALEVIQQHIRDHGGVVTSMFVPQGFKEFFSKNKKAVYEQKGEMMEEVVEEGEMLF